ncbi:MAG: response regulator [Acetivibrionales bacterium]|jgi:two-component system response regulator YesN
MYRILIVDDEPIALDSVEYIIKNNIKGLEVCGRARSGREAIEKAYNLRPDIVLIDIKMPGINGLEAIRKIREFNKEVYSIIISAYDYFDYAVEAMNLGVVEYLLKPVKEEKLIEALLKTIAVIDQKRKRISQELELKEKLEILVPTLENGFIHSICMFEDNTEELKTFGRLFELEKFSGYVMAVEFGEKETGGIQNKISASVKTQNHYVDCRDILKSICQCIVGPIMLNRLIVYVMIGSSKDNFSIKTSATRLAKDFIDRIRDTFGEVSVGIGRCYQEVVNAKKSYREAMKALQTLSNSKDNILHIDDMIEEYQDSPDFEEKFEHDIYSKVAQGDLNSTLVAFDNLFNQIADSVGNLEGIKDQCIVLIVGFTNRWGDIAKDYYKVLNKIITSADQNELKTIIRKYIEKVINELTVNRQLKINQIIEKADNYLLKNYTDDISLEDIARVVNLSPYYFSRFYKEASGVNFIDRLIAIRIEKAKQYFENTDLSLKEVSGMVGYQDPNYFSKLFKKITGYTATEYKEYYRK